MACRLYSLIGGCFTAAVTTYAKAKRASKIPFARFALL